MTVAELIAELRITMWDVSTSAFLDNERRKLILTKRVKNMANFND